MCKIEHLRKAPNILQLNEGLLYLSGGFTVSPACEEVGNQLLKTDRLRYGRLWESGTLAFCKVKERFMDVLQVLHLLESDMHILQNLLFFKIRLLFFVFFNLHGPLPFLFFL